MIDDRSLDELFSRATSESPVPSGLVDRVEIRIVRRQRARRSLGGGVLFAAMASGVFLFVSARPNVPAPGIGPIPPELAVATKPARVTLDNTYMTQQLESTHPNVTIVRVYQRHIDVEAEPPADPSSKAPGPGLPDSPQTQLVTRS